MSESYYVRIRGSVHGPYTEETVMKLAQAGKVSRAHQISLDGKEWQSAQDFPHLFAARRVENKSTGGTGGAPVAPAAASGAPKQWYYTTSGEQKGPVSEQDLRAMISAGGLSSQEQVWTPGFAEWVPVTSAVPFQALFPHRMEHARSLPIEVGNRDDMMTVSPGMRRDLLASLGWIWFIVIVGFVLSFALLCCAIWLASQESKTGFKAILFPSMLRIDIGVPALYSIAACVAVLAGTACLYGHASALARYSKEASAEHFLKAARWLNCFWCYLAIAIIVVITVAIVLLLSVQTISIAPGAGAIR